MPPKKFKPDAEHGFIGDVKSKYKPPPYEESERMKQYRRHRDICYYIQHGGGCKWGEEDIEEVRGLYFKTLF